MRPAASTADVLSAVQEAKGGGGFFHTNFFPDREKLESWVSRGEILLERHPGALLVFRADRGFRHLSFCARDLLALESALRASESFNRHTLVADLVGRGQPAPELEQLLLRAGFQPYSSLIRLARTGGEPPPAPAAAERGHAPIGLANAGDAERVGQFLETVFDPFRDQLPHPTELHRALAAGQIAMIEHQGQVAALLHSETQGVTSSVRYWGVAEAFRSQGYGAILMRQYLSQNRAVRRFLLWVAAANQDAIQKYRHYGYAPDGLTDTILKKA